MSNDIETVTVEHLDLVNKVVAKYLEGSDPTRVEGYGI